jgi:hypothetical protein
MPHTRNQQQPSELSHKDMLNLSRKLARKYKAMSLPVQRMNAIQDALFWRRLG